MQRDSAATGRHTGLHLTSLNDVKPFKWALDQVRKWPSKNQIQNQNLQNKNKNEDGLSGGSGHDTRPDRWRLLWEWAVKKSVMTSARWSAHVSSTHPGISSGPAALSMFTPSRVYWLWPALCSRRTLYSPVFAEEITVIVKHVQPIQHGLSSDPHLPHIVSAAGVEVSPVSAVTVNIN